MDKLETLKQEILADGRIDAAEVDRLKEMLYADGVKDKKEANFLFELNDAVSEKENAAISDYILKDEISPGIIDENEAEWLKERIGADGKVDGIEKKLLIHLIDNAKIVPDELKTLLK